MYFKAINLPEKWKSKIVSQVTLKITKTFNCFHPMVSKCMHPKGIELLAPRAKRCPENTAPSTATSSLGSRRKRQRCGSSEFAQQPVSTFKRAPNSSSLPEFARGCTKTVAWACICGRLWSIFFKFWFWWFIINYKLLNKQWNSPIVWNLPSITVSYQQQTHLHFRIVLTYLTSCNSSQLRSSVRLSCLTRLHAHLLYLSLWWNHGKGEKETDDLYFAVTARPCKFDRRNCIVLANQLAIVEAVKPSRSHCSEISTCFPPGMIRCNLATFKSVLRRWSLRICLAAAELATMWVKESAFAYLSPSFAW